MHVLQPTSSKASDDATWENRTGNLTVSKFEEAPDGDKSPESSDMAESSSKAKEGDKSKKKGKKK